MCVRFIINGNRNSFALMSRFRPREDAVIRRPRATPAGRVENTIIFGFTAARLTAHRDKFPVRFLVARLEAGDNNVALTIQYKSQLRPEIAVDFHEGSVATGFAEKCLELLCLFICIF